MPLGILKAVAGVVAATSILTFVGPVVGEWAATLPPLWLKATLNPWDALGLYYEDVAFPTSDGLTLRGWFIPAQTVDAPAIVYAPATAHDQRSGLSLAPAFHRAGFHVLLFSYRGHARSDGLKGRFTYGDAESKDVDAAVRFLRESKGLRQIGIIGHSAGAVSAILSAARNPNVGAVVAVAPYACLREVWYANRPPFVPRFISDITLWLAERWKGFDSDNVCPQEVIQRIAPRPLLLIHGTRDRRITEAQIRRLFAAAEEPKGLWLVAGATHEGIREPVLDELSPDVIAFFDAAFRPQDERAAALAHSLERVGTSGASPTRQRTAYDPS